MAKYSEKKKKLKTSQYAGVDNAWIAPNGDLYRCGYMGHNEWASEYIQHNLCKGDFVKAHEMIDEIHNNSYSAYPYTALHKLGWVRILTWSNDTALYSETDKPTLTHEQKDTLMFWCSANNTDYETFISKCQ